MSWLRGLIFRRRMYDELSAEIREHLEEKIEELVAEGMPRKDAEAKARREFGNVTLLEERGREVWQWPRLETFAMDVRYALRMLRKSPGFTAVAVLTLALGIGANTAMFSIVDAVLLHSLPYKDPDRLVWLTESLPDVPDNNVSWLDMQDWRAQNNVFEGIAGYHDSSFVLTDPVRPQFLQGRFVSQDYFEVMGVPALLGRTFKFDENQVGGPPVVVLSHSVWMQHFAGDPTAIGKILELNNKAFIVVGIMPAGFGNITHTTLWAPLEESISKTNLTQRQFSWGMYAVARLRPGVSFQRASTDIFAISQRLERQYPKTTGGLAVMLPLAQHIVGFIRPALLMLSAAVFFLLVIACTNIASLLLVKAVGRQKEIAVRLALGAGKWRLFRQLIVESMVLSLAGAVLGAVLAVMATKLFLVLLPADAPFASLISVNRSALLFTLGLTLLAGLFFGLAPALMGLGFDFQGVLKSGSHQVQGGHRRAHRALVITEVGLAAALLIGAGLMIRSMTELFRVAPGFDTHQLLTETVLLGRAYSHSLTPQQIASTFDQAVSRVRQLPGVEAVAAAFPVPFSPQALQEAWNLTLLAIKGRLPRTGELFFVHSVTATTDYFHTLGIPLIAGRTFTPADTWSSQPVAVIDEEVAKRYWPGQNPVGSQIKLFVQDFSDPSQKALTVVGVVGTVKAGGLDADFGGYVYSPQSQQLNPSMTLVVRSRVSPLSLARSVESAIHEVTPDSPVFRVQTMDEMVQASQATRRLSLRLLGAFSAAALLLAALGLYGVISYIASQSTNEIGVRVALGAQRGDILRLILRQGMRLALSGVLVGVASALVLTRLMASLLYGVGAMDPLTFVSVSTLLVLVALAACYIPARRAMKVDPMVALRYE